MCHLTAHFKNGSILHLTAVTTGINGYADKKNFVHVTIIAHSNSIINIFGQKQPLKLLAWIKRMKEYLFVWGKLRIHVCYSIFGLQNGNNDYKDYKFKKSNIQRYNAI